MIRIYARLQERRHLVEWLFLLAMLLALGSFIGYSRYEEYVLTETQERERLASQATVIEKNLVYQLVASRRAINSILEGLPSWQRQVDGLKLADQQLRILTNSMTGVRNILIINAEGRVISSNNEELVGRDFSKEDHFQNALKNPDPKLIYVTPPFKSVLNAYVIAAYRIIPGPSGEFAGIVIATFGSERFKTLLDSVRYTADTRSAIIHGDGKIFMVEPGGSDLIGRDLATPASLFTRHRNSGQSAGVYSAATYLTGEARVVAFRTIQPAELFMDKPLVVTTSRDVNAIFAPWRREFNVECGIFGALALIAVLSLFLYQQRQRIFERLADSQEQLLQASEARLHSFFDATPDVLLIADAQGLITTTNRRVELLLGYAVDELLGQSIEVLVPDGFRATHPALCAKFVASPSTRQMGLGLVTRARRKDGSEVAVEVHLSQIETEQGRFVACAMRDITERKRAEADLRLAAAAFESQEALVITDANSVILRVNRAFTQITGYSAEEAIGQTPRLLQSGRHDAEFYRSMWETIHRTGGWQGEIWDRRKNGEVYPKWITISAVKNDEGVVTHYIGAHYDITTRKQAEEKINHLAFYDQLTGLPNRTLLQDRLNQAMTSGARSGNYGALLFIDLDNFKTLNDTLGHDMGDLLLKQVAQRLATCVRAGDTVARLGGDEFIVMLASLSMSESDAATQTEAVGEKILAALNQTYPLKEVAYHCTPSIGATLFCGQQASIDDLLKQADLAMYKSKDSGRNALRFFDPDMESVVMKRAELEKDLRVAVEKKQFLLHYQAQVVGGQLTGSEVLVRWLHPQRGMVSPADFIPLAEETGLILPLGHWVLETACSQLAAWATRPGMAHLTVAVNVSAHQFRQTDFVAQVLAVLKSTGANPRRLKLELTESMLVENVQEIIEKMFALRAQGVGFSLDDFGTGYSSLSYLKRLPLDQLKIDQSFVRDVLSDPNDAAIAKTVIALAQSLGLGVIAEGVETEAQRDFLANAGCHAYQGYFFSKPLPVDAFEQFAQRT